MVNYWKPLASATNAGIFANDQWPALNESTFTGNKKRNGLKNYFQTHLPSDSAAIEITNLSESTVEQELKDLDDSTAIKITNLPKKTTYKDLEDLVKPFGDIHKLFLPKKNKAKLCMGSAQVHFKTKAEAARAIIVLNGYKHNNLMLKVDWLIPPPKQKPDDTLPVTISNIPNNTTYQDIENLIRPIGCARKIFLPKSGEIGLPYGIVHYKRNSEAARAIRMLNGQKYNRQILNVDWFEPLLMPCEEDTEITEAVIRISNLPENTTDQDLKDLIKPLKNIHGCFLAQDKKTNICKGFAYVYFESQVEAKKAVTMLKDFEYNHLILKVNLIDPCKHNTIQVSNLSENTTYQDLENLLNKSLKGVRKLYLYKANRRRFCYGFADVYFETIEGASEALETLNGYSFNNSILSTYSINIEKQILEDDTGVVRICNLPKSTTNKDLKSLLDQFDDVQKLVLPKEKKKDYIQGTAYVHFESKAEAARAINVLNNRIFNSRILKADWFEDLQKQKRNNNATVSISNLSKNTTDQDLENLIESFEMNVNSWYLGKYKNTNICRGFANANFKSKEEAAKAIGLLNGFVYNKSKLVVDWMKFPQTCQENSKAIRIYNLPKSISERELNNLVKPFGDVQKLRLSREVFCQGFARVHFQTKADTERALNTFNGFKYENLVLSVDWSESTKVKQLNDDRIMKMSESRNDRNQDLEDFVKKFVVIKKRYLCKERRSSKVCKPFGFTDFINLTDWQSEH